MALGKGKKGPSKKTDAKKADAVRGKGAARQTRTEAKGDSYGTGGKNDRPVLDHKYDPVNPGLM